MAYTGAEESAVRPRPTLANHASEVIGQLDRAGEMCRELESKLFGDGPSVNAKAGLNPISASEPNLQTLMDSISNRSSMIVQRLTSLMGRL